jgi:hypothetical protein
VGRRQTPETRAKISATRKRLGLKPTRECIAKGKANQVGPKHPRWNPNKSTDAIDRLLFETYVRPLIRQRDNFTCAVCDARGGKLHVHHVKPFSVCAELRFSFVNCLTLCVECHKVLHSGLGFVPERALQLWKVLRAQLTNKKESEVELTLLTSLRAYRDVLAANQGDITSAWKALETAMKAYKGFKNYD